MRRTARRGLVAVAIISALAVVVLPIGPASAHLGNGVAAFTGTAATSSPGVWAPVSPFCGSLVCPDGDPTINWSFTSSTDAVVHPGSPAGLGSKRVTGSGTLVGWCGRSVGQGTTFLKNPITVSHQFNIKWQSAGTFLVLTDTVAPGRLVALVNARAAGSTATNVKCVHSIATAFTVVGVAAAIK